MAKARLSSLLDTVATGEESVTITRHGRPAAVLLSPEEFESWQETLAIRSDPSLMREIRRGLASLRRTRKLYTLEELFEPTKTR